VNARKNLVISNALKQGMPIDQVSKLAASQGFRLMVDWFVTENLLENYFDIFSLAIPPHWCVFFFPNLMLPSRGNRLNFFQLLTGHAPRK
jgi:hypothetical protein